MKSPLIVPNKAKGEKIFHVWNGSVSTYVFTQRGGIGIRNAVASLRKKYGKVYIDIPNCARKNQISAYYK